MPKISNQKANAYLKEIASQMQLRKNLTFRCARHTFATTVTLTNSVPIETSPNTAKSAGPGFEFYHPRQ